MSGDSVYHLHIGLVKLVVNPIGMAVKILNRVKSGPQRDKRKSILRPVVNTKLLITGDQLLRALQQAMEHCIEIRILLQVAVQIIEMEKERRAANLRIVGLIERGELCSARTAGCGLRDRAEEVREKFPSCMIFQALSVKPKCSPTRWTHCSCQ